MKPEIILTKHAIDEYKKDNPYCIEPESILKQLFAIMLWHTKRKTKKARFWKDDEFGV
jgi:hypothetical protein